MGAQDSYTVQAVQLAGEAMATSSETGMMTIQPYLLRTPPRNLLWFPLTPLLHEPHETASLTQNTSFGVDALGNLLEDADRL